MNDEGCKGGVVSNLDVHGEGTIENLNSGSRIVVLGTISGIGDRIKVFSSTVYSFVFPIVSRVGIVTRLVSVGSMLVREHNVPLRVFPVTLDYLSLADSSSFPPIG